MPDKKWKKLDPGNTHNFEETPELLGTYVGVEEKAGMNGSNLYTLETAGGNKVDFWGSTVLDRVMKKAAIGDELKIQYLGMEKNTKNGREYKNFEVLVAESE
jgi:hypothetical protein